MPVEKKGFSNNDKAEMITVNEFMEKKSGSVQYEVLMERSRSKSHRSIIRIRIWKKNIHYEGGWDQSEGKT